MSEHLAPLCECGRPFKHSGRHLGGMRVRLRPSEIPHPETRAEIVAALPMLFRSAIKLTRHKSAADDLVQETALHALRAIESYQAGTSMQSWLYIIMRNAFFTEFRKRKHEVPAFENDRDTRRTSPSQEDSVMLREVREAIERLDPIHRDALMLVPIGAASYDEAARIERIAVGTMKSRVFRARAELVSALR